MSVKSDIDQRFSSHKCDEKGVTKMRMIRKRVRELAYSISLHCPDGRDKSVALTELASVMYYANAAIAFPYPIEIEEVNYDPLLPQNEIFKQEDEDIDVFGC